MSVQFPVRFHEGSAEAIHFWLRGGFSREVGKAELVQHVDDDGFFDEPDGPAE
jgi:hypothetical protein